MQRMFCVDAIRYKLRQMSTLAITSTLVLSALAPVLLMGQASAAQITERKITMSTSQRAATGVTYILSFKPATTIGTAQGMVIEFCANSPLIGATCTAPANGNTLEGFNVGNTVDNSWVVDGSSTASRLNLTHAGETFTAGVDYVLTISGVTNPTYDGVQPATFYARVLTYAGSSAGLDSASNTGSFTDQGGIALTTNNQLRIDARVQEELEFCVGTVNNTVVSDGTAPANCSAAAFSGATPTVDLGTIGSGTLTVSPVDATAGGNNMNGAAMIRTNAVNGAVIAYFAEQDSGSGRLKVAGASCSGATIAPLLADSGSGVTDQCFNSNPAKTDFTSVNGEKFGMSAGTVYRPTGSTTINLTPDTVYNGTTTEFAWEEDDATATTLATSTTVMDYEMLLLRFAARTAATTPTGSYSVTSTYIATSTY